ncbi:hypothetical protein LCGC14_2511470 [marine sediment metagenome]|uniref:HTH marR-type domain-containing protein n=1 Tax=marine sediment metagenome TaxID=412755 RepID=A0A0F9DSG6_9ZZZZ
MYSLSKKKELGLFTARGRLLIQVTKKPGTTIKELSKDLFLTKRSVWGIVGELRSIGYLTVTTGELILGSDGRTHHYFISSFGLAELRKLTEQVDKGVGLGTSP